MGSARPQATIYRLERLEQIPLQYAAEPAGRPQPAEQLGLFAVDVGAPPAAA